ncbi:hypothetical protein BDZ94DRAFT_1236093 [Collybia nuda]|uniref:Uncharacterized protein n=1 Tax=Collybia nuda TaxID=64659 RepID=A0A9P6CK40_9AGAR|nr:hypothetical protein BDZ94DRAFT_1236093 [Collybia nuda]
MILRGYCSFPRNGPFVLWDPQKELQPRFSSLVLMGGAGGEVLKNRLFPFGRDLYLYHYLTAQWAGELHRPHFVVEFYPHSTFTDPWNATWYGEIWGRFRLCTVCPPVECSAGMYWVWHPSPDSGGCLDDDKTGCIVRGSGVRSVEGHGTCCVWYLALFSLMEKPFQTTVWHIVVPSYVDSIISTTKEGPQKDDGGKAFSVQRHTNFGGFYAKLLYVHHEVAKAYENVPGEVGR